MNVRNESSPTRRVRVRFSTSTANQNTGLSAKKSQNRVLRLSLLGERSQSQSLIDWRPRHVLCVAHVTSQTDVLSEDGGDH